MASAADDADASVLRRVATTGPGKTVSRFPERGLLFSSRFDGGNMASVEQLASGAFSVNVSEDAAAFGISTGYSTWFYLEVERGPIGSKREGKTTKNPQELQLVLANLNPHRGLFQNGYTVMYSSVEVVDSTEETTAATPCVFQDERRWARLPTTLSFEKYSAPVGQKTPEQGENSAVEQQQGNEEDGGESGHETTGPQKSLVAAAGETTVASEGKQELKIRVSFTYRFKFARERVRFAFCYPYTYTRVQEELAAMDKLFARTKLQPECSPTNEKAPTNVYYHRELLTRSLEGLRVDLVTISSMDGITSTRGPPKRSLDASQLESAFQFDPKQKKMVVISARVHSGETPANFMLDGFYRTDTRGVNLNRVYEDPQPEFAPAVFALKNFLLDIVIDYGGADSQSAQDNIVYLDLHAHANRRGCFIFGNNHLPDTLIDSNNDAIETAIARQVKTQLYARLVGLHTPFFDYMACLFDKDNMTRRDLRDNNNATTSRQGSSRVALYRVTGLTYVYTIECNFNEGRRNLRASSLVPSSSAPAAAATSSAGPTRRCPSSKGSAKRVQADSLRMSRQTAPTSGTRLYLKYSPAEWKDVGIGALVALLDLFELPGAGQRLEESPFRSRDGIRKNLLAEIKSVASNEGGTSAKTSRLSKPKTRHGAKPQIQVKA
ncbi:putative metalloprotease family M14A [Phytophthora cinnamomi]|uniref:putative metalloprotease family M14A n=1 Tax=Phytophthora cinnamomi TaxID=4785 RepID=UPI003559C621|nr:putative metalloprotease family M14A [Phytophthora cinnamomi]